MVGISLQFAAESGLPSWMIEFYGHGSFAHVDVFTPDGNLLGARIVGGVAIRTPGYAPFTRVLRIDLEADQPTVDAFWTFINAQVGKPYDKRAIAAFAFGRVWRRPEAWFCSELIAAGLETCSWFPYQLVTATNRITPPDLLLALSAVMPIKGWTQ